MKINYTWSYVVATYKEKFKSFLKERDLKYTPEREEIIEVIIKFYNN